MSGIEKPLRMRWNRSWVSLVRSIVCGSCGGEAISTEGRGAVLRGDGLVAGTVGRQATVELGWGTARSESFGTVAQPLTIEAMQARRAIVSRAVIVPRVIH